MDDAGRIRLLESMLKAAHAERTRLRNGDEVKALRRERDALAEKLGEAETRERRLRTQVDCLQAALLAIAERGGCCHWSHRIIQDAGVRLPPDLLPD